MPSPITLEEWLRRRDTEYVPLVRQEEDLRRNISDGTPFGQALQEMVIRDLWNSIEVLKRQIANLQKRVPHNFDKAES